MKDGWVDVLATFFDDPELPSPNDGAILPGPLEMTEEDLQRQARLTKTPRGRIPNDLDSNDSAASSSDDDIIWSEKGNRRTQPLRDAKGKAPMGEEDEEVEGGEEEDSYADSDFELLPSEDNLLLPSQRQSEKERDRFDEEDRAAARALADKDQVRVQQRIEEEATWRMAVRPPTRVNTHGAASAPPSACTTGASAPPSACTTGGLHTNEVQQHHQMQCVQVLLQQSEKQQKEDPPQLQEVQKQLHQHQDEKGRNQCNVRLEQRQQKEKHAVQPEEQPAQCIVQQEQQQGQRHDQPKGQQQQEDEQQPPYVDCPPSFPEMDESLVHDNLEISRAGRKKENGPESPIAPVVKRGRGRLRKGQGRPDPPPPPATCRPSTRSGGRSLHKTRETRARVERACKSLRMIRRWGSRVA
ncbi:hypothetical protein CBR_g51234 [Chara braunii]|uniref:Uncharacterized protein n=1 Tax=Chara braunii TaxID=69332 RepID=A0A388M863_CHABU|nr:hypothetical protein CBR_g51234 [Chara braunii]|eukprot:GBG90726.1 hypothetical protein CBR_g51234 [Chara braunii]